MRKTRSQTQAENAILTNQSRRAENQQNHLQPDYTDAEFVEVRNMLMPLRVFELQRLLISLNIQPGGRKIDLQNRLLEILKKDFTQVSAKIKSIYRACSIREENITTTRNTPNSDIMYQQQMQMQVQPDLRATAALIGNNIVVPFNAGLQQHVPIHPDVRLKKLAFYDVLATLIQPSSLVPQNNNRTQETSYFFTLTPQQATDIASNRDMRNGSKVEYTIQVQLRFCLLETSCEQEDCFPTSVMVKVNNKPCQLPNPIPTNRPNVEPKRPPRPVNVTANIKLSPTVTNTITVQWNPDFSKQYCISVYLVRKLTSQQLLNRMKSKGVKPADYTRALIKEKLNEDADCEIATTMLRVSLMCPLGKMRMLIPSRASTCSHLQCFDASLFLQMNERKPTWNCPVCDKPAIYETLVIDGYFQEVLASPLLSSDDNEIQLHKDGSWSTLQMRGEAQVLDTPSKKNQKVEVISDDLEVITEVEVSNAKPAVAAAPAITPAAPAVATVKPTATTPNEPPTSTTNSDMIDLTMSDSEDEDSAKAKAAAAKQTNSTIPVAKVLPLNAKTNNNEKQKDDENITDHDNFVAVNMNRTNTEQNGDGGDDEDEEDDESDGDDDTDEDENENNKNLDKTKLTNNSIEPTAREKLRKLWEKTEQQRKLVTQLIQKDKKSKKTPTKSPSTKYTTIMKNDDDDDASLKNPIRFRLTTIRTDDDKNKGSVIKLERISNDNNHIHSKTLHSKCKTKAKN